MFTASAALKTLRDSARLLNETQACALRIVLNRRMSVEDHGRPRCAAVGWPCRESAMSWLAITCKAGPGRSHRRRECERLRCVSRIIWAERRVIENKCDFAAVKRAD